MKTTADTNVLISAVVQDDPHQARQATKAMREADLVAVPIPVLCEFVRVLRRGYKRPVSDVPDAIHRLMKIAKVVMNRPAIEAGLSVLGAGGDFADAVIAHEGDWLGRRKNLIPSTEGCFCIAIAELSSPFVVIGILAM